jgi:hypothetical protein
VPSFWQPFLVSGAVVDLQPSILFGRLSVGVPEGVRRGFFPDIARREPSLFRDRRGGADPALTVRGSGGGVTLGAQVHLPVADGNLLLRHCVARPCLDWPSPIDMTDFFKRFAP